MRILLAHQCDPDAGLGGSEIHVAAVARVLAKRHEVAVVFPGSSSSSAVMESRRDGVFFYEIPPHSKAEIGFESYRAKDVRRSCASVLERWNPDLLHIHHLNRLSTGLVFEARSRGVSVVLTLHDFWLACPLGQLLTLDLKVCPGPSPKRCVRCVGTQAAVPSARGVLRKPDSLLHRLAGRTLAPFARFSPLAHERIGARIEEMKHVTQTADMLISPSRFLAERMRALGFPECRVIPNGIERPKDAALQRPLARPDAPLRVGFVGSVIPSKGVHVLVEAVRRFSDSRIQLEIHGAAPAYHGDATYLSRIKIALGDSAADVVRGPFSHNELADVLSGLDVMVAPSIWEENAPLTVQEAFVHGVAVVASGHGGLAELVQDGVNGLLFTPGDPSDLARVLSRVVNDRSMLAALTQRASLEVPTVEEHAVKLEAAYAESRERFRTRVGRPGVVVLDFERPEDALVGARSAKCPEAAPIVIVRNGASSDAPDAAARDAGFEILNPPTNLGYAGGMNAGIAFLRSRNCDRFLLLNSDARLEPGTLRALAEALDTPDVAAATPLVVGVDGRIQHRGGSYSLSTGRALLLGEGEEPSGRSQAIRISAVPGAVWMLSAHALDIVGELNSELFFSLEDFEWSVRARAKGLELVCVTSVVARHEGAATIGRSSSARLYYAARNHLHVASQFGPPAIVARSLRLGFVTALQYFHALKQADVPRIAASGAFAAVSRGIRDFRKGRLGPL